MKIERTWSSVITAFSVHRAYDEQTQMLRIMKENARGDPGAYWELGSAVLFELRHFNPSVVLGYMFPHKPITLLELPFTENKDLSGYSIVLHYEEEEESPMEKKTRTYCVNTEEGTHEYVAAGYSIGEGYLTIYDKDRNVATYPPLVWTMIWEKDRCKVP